MLVEGQSAKYLRLENIALYGNNQSYWLFSMVDGLAVLFLDDIVECLTIDSYTFEHP